MDFRQILEQQHKRHKENVEKRSPFGKTNERKAFERGC